MLTIFQFIISSLPIFLAIAIPGFLLSLALLRKTNLHLFEIFIIGIPIGITAPALLTLIEFLFGIQYTPMLTFMNILIISVAAIAIILKEKIRIFPEKIVMNKEIKLILILAVILFFAWWIRAQATSPYFYEFDPYWYNIATQEILTKGGVPLQDDLVWYPNFESRRGVNLIQYAIAGWYSIYAAFNGISEFNFELSSMIASIYPPIAAMLLAFFGYLWFSKEYNKYLGLVAAALLAFTPVLVDKMLAGEFELTPWGLFGIIFFYSTYYLTLKTGSKRFAILSGYALLTVITGAPGWIIPSALFAVVFSILSIQKFFKNELTKEFIILNGIIVAFSLFAGITKTIYLEVGIGGIYDELVPTAALVLSTFLYYIKSETKTTEDKLLYLSGAFVAAIAVLVLTPLGQIATNYAGTFFYVTTYVNPTMQTIAEQTAAPKEFSGTLGILGLNIANISATPIILLLSFLLSLFSFVTTIVPSSLIALIGVYPIALSGLFKAKYTPYIGLMVPIAFCILVGEIWKFLKNEKHKKYLLIFVGVIAIVQAFSYFDLVISSFGIAATADVTNNTLFNSEVCNKKYTELNELAQQIQQTIPQLANFFIQAKYNTIRTYCTRIPDHWLDAMYWIRNNAAEEERTISWWDYGHWINTFGQRKSVTGNTHQWPIMHQEVADKLVHNTPEALTKYMKEHKAKYLLLDEDLIGKWGALVYHSCYYNNQTKMEQGPGNSECDRLHYPEYIYLPKNPTANDVCKTKAIGQATKIYSSLAREYKFDYYCLPGGLNSLEYKYDSRAGKVFGMQAVYENGSQSGISEFIILGETQDGYYYGIALYPSNSQDKKGDYYNSIFYKGFFEGKIEGFTQVHPNIYTEGPKLPVRIYKIS